MSIWSGIDRAAFETNLTRLCKHQKVQQASKLSALRGNLADGRLPRKVEKDLADSFAFLAATSDQPSRITASAIGEAEQHICVILAANEGLAKPTVNALQGVIDCLKQQAAHKISAAASEQTCRILILNIHRERILRRLLPPRGQSSHTHIGARARELLGRSMRNDTRLTLQKLIDAIDDTDRIRAKAAPGEDSIYRILQSSYDLMYGSHKLFDTIPNRTLSREYRVLRALANYWRVCQLLVKCVKRHRSVFQELDLEILTPSPAKISNGTRRFVHAEVQIVVHFESTCMESRYIASSKRPCFLCYCFIRAHGAYDLLRSHGETYDMWTVPDDQLSHHAASANINRALAITVQDVQHALSQEQQPIYLHSTQTVSKNLLDRLSSAPSSSVAPGSTEDLVQGMAAMSTLPSARTARTSDPGLGSKVGHNPHSICIAERETYILNDQVELFLDIGSDSAPGASFRQYKLAEIEHTREQTIQVDVCSLRDGEVVDLTFPSADSAFLLLQHGRGRSLIQLCWC